MLTLFTRHACILPLLLTAPSFAQDEEPPKLLEGHSMHGQAFDEGPRQAAQLLEGMAEIEFPVTAKSEQARAFFLQGVAQLHGFWFFESERSFRQAAALDPEFGMAYWGMAMSNIDLRPPESQIRARGFAAEALRRLEGASELERAWIEGLAAYYEVEADKLPDPAKRGEKWKPKADEKKRRRELVRAIEAICREHPEHVEAKAFLAVMIWWNMGRGQAISSHQPVDYLLDMVFDAKPMHPAHHYRIHLWDRENAKLAVRSAVLSGPSNPGVAHNWHMGGHIFDRLNRHREASWLQEASSRVDHQAMRRDRVMPFLTHNYGHNQEWLSRSLMALGRMHEAYSIAANLVELPRHPKHNAPKKRGSISAYGQLRLLDIVEAFEDWDRLEQLRASGHVRPENGERDERARYHALVGRAAVVHGDLEQAARAREALAAVRAEAQGERLEKAEEAERKALEEKKNEEQVHDAMKKALKDASGSVRAVEGQLALLDAWIAHGEGDDEGAKKHLEKAKRASALAKADLLDALGDHEKALKELNGALKRKPGFSQLLARKARALYALEKEDELRECLEELADRAAYANLEAPLFQHLATAIAAAGLETDWRRPTPWPEDFEETVALSTLGPFRWSPVAAPALSGVDLQGTRRELSEWDGKPRVVVFYLGFGCLHCVEQLQVIQPLQEKYRDAGLQLIAVGTDDLEEMRDEIAGLPPAEGFDFPFLADPEMHAFKAWHAYDDFEEQPLHGTFLLDAQGRVRWQDVGPEPFMEMEWLLSEAQRLTAIAPVDEH